MTNHKLHFLTILAQNIFHKSTTKRLLLLQKALHCQQLLYVLQKRLEFTEVSFLCGTYHTSHTASGLSKKLL